MRRPAALGLLLAALLAAPASAATLPAGFSDDLVMAADQPTALAFLPDGRLLVTSKNGRLWLHSGGGQPAQVVDLSARICPERERGLLGVAVDPDFSDNRHLYLYFTFNKHNTCALAAPPNGPVNRLSRFTLGADNRIAPSSEVVLIDNIPSYEGIHNAGYLAFGNDGYLYVTVGDGAIGANARNRSVLNGKVLRITASGGIPADNPYRGANSARCSTTGSTTLGTICQEIYAWGLRNPFRLGFDPHSSRFFINDVGLASWEEVNEGKAGADYGWNVREGHCAFNSTTDCGPPPAGMTNPIYDYGHASPGCGAITGGAFVPKGVWPSAYEGRYLFADFNCGQIRSLRPTLAGWIPEAFGNSLGAVADLRFGPFGSSQALYYVTWSTTGQVRRITYTGNRTPVAVAKATPTEGASVPLTVSFDAASSSDPDGDALSYIWNFGDGTTSTAASPSHVYPTAGTYMVSLRVTDARGASATDRLRIDAGNTSPTPAIQSPAAGTLFRVGQRITLSGTASDPQDGALPPSSMSWTVLLHHGLHTHPFLGPQTGNDIGFDAPAPEDLRAADTSWLEVRLTATDSKGLVRTVTRELRPRKVGVIFFTEPSGLGLVVDGIPVKGPVGFQSWEGYRYDVEALQFDGLNGKVYAFSSWADGATRKRTITTGASGVAYTARWNEAQCGGGVGIAMLIVFAVGAVARRIRR